MRLHLAAAGRRHVEDHFRWDVLAVPIADVLAAGTNESTTDRGAAFGAAS